MISARLFRFFLDKDGRGEFLSPVRRVCVCVCVCVCACVGETRKRVRACSIFFLIDLGFFLIDWGRGEGDVQQIPFSHVSRLARKPGNAMTDTTGLTGVREKKKTVKSHGCGWTCFLLAITIRYTVARPNGTHFWRALQLEQSASPACHSVARRTAHEQTSARRNITFPFPVFFCIYKSYLPIETPTTRPRVTGIMCQSVRLHMDTRTTMRKKKHMSRCSRRDGRPLACACAWLYNHDVEGE